MRQNVHFPEWQEHLNRSNLSVRQMESFAVIITWYLNFFKRGRVPVDFVSSRDFIQVQQAS
jgi:hypothetical protein